MRGGVIISYKAPEVFWQDKSLRLLLSLIVTALALLLMLAYFGKQVDIVVGNRIYPVYTFKSTVAQVIEEQNIIVDDGDLVTPQLVAPAEDGQVVKIVRVDKQEEIVHKKVPFKVIRQVDDRLPQGIEKVNQNGIDGLKKMVYLKVLNDGIEVSRDLVKTEMIKEPQPKIIAVGRRTVVHTTSRSLEMKRTVTGNTLTAQATAYTFTGYNTSTGITPYRGVVAVDPNVIPLGTRLYIENYGEAVALDTGGSIKGNRIDLFFCTREEALNWGRRTVNVQILLFIAVI